MSGSPSNVSPSSDPAADREWLPIGLALCALRVVLRGTGDALLALQYLFFDLDVNDPQVTPALAEDGVDVAQAPALEAYLCRRARPWMRRIDAGDRSAVVWAEAARTAIREWMRARPEARAWAEAVLSESAAAHPAAVSYTQLRAHETAL
ncbi:MAG: hypothetical protein QUU85_09565, partial [Candidatus Eisenbacteria bacterium]|nr:hypothetical protein [Candidatus Eisenbacteria bacterium]